MEFKDLKINITGRLVTLNSKTVPLTYTEFELLTLLLKNQGKALDRMTILSALSNNNTEVFHQVIDKHIENLRKKLGSTGKHIETVRNIGYRFN